MQHDMLVILNFPGITQGTCSTFRQNFWLAIIYQFNCECMSAYSLNLLKFCIFLTTVLLLKYGSIKKINLELFFEFTIHWTLNIYTKYFVYPVRVLLGPLIHSSHFVSYMHCSFNFNNDTVLVYMMMYEHCCCLNSK